MPQSTFDTLPLFFIRIQCASSVFLLFEAKIKMSRVLAVARQCEFFFLPIFYSMLFSFSEKLDFTARLAWALSLQFLLLHITIFVLLLFLMMIFFLVAVAIASAAAAVTASAAALVVIVIFGSVFSVPLPGFCALSIC